MFSMTGSHGISRKNAIKRYYKRPNKCKFCNSVIKVREDERVTATKKRLFCDRICFGKHQSKVQHGKARGDYKNRMLEKPETCSVCGEKFILRRLDCGLMSQKTRCNDCTSKAKFDPKITKGQLREKLSSYQSYRSTIQRMARKVFFNSDRPKECIECKYDTHIDVCHIIPVSKFPDDTKISVINNIKNLVGLCKNHHWELDKGFLKITP